MELDAAGILLEASLPPAAELHHVEVQKPRVANQER